MIRRWLVLCAVLIAGCCGCAADAVDEAFRHPPREARTHCYWWWLNGNTDEPTITKDLEEMAAKGYGGAIIIDADGSNQFGNNAVPAGPMFGSEPWRKLYLHAVREAARLNLELSLTIQSGWNLGGPSVKPEQASKLLTFSRALAGAGHSGRTVLEQPASKNGFYRDIAVVAYPLHAGATMAGAAGDKRKAIRELQEKAAFKEYGRSMPVTTSLLEDVPAEAGETDYAVREVVDLTSKMDPSGEVRWAAPAGEWEVLRIGYTDSGAKVSTSSGAWQGLAVDHLDRDAFNAYWDENVEPLLSLAKPYLGKSLRYLVTDSWELGGANWCVRFRDEFKRRRGYDLLPFLPVTAGRIAGDRDISNRFLNDFRRTIGELIRDEHYAVFARRAQEHGLGIHPESGGPHGAPIDGLKTLGLSSFPQAEFWARSATHRSTDPDRFFVKEAASAAHTYGKARVAAEGMTSIGPQWEESIWNNLKPSFDQAICSGLNLLFWHTFTSAPAQFGLPGREYFAGTHLNRNVTWWNYAGPFIAYLNRTQALMQQGEPVSDVLYYYGDRVPNFVQLQAADPAKALPGYDYDVVDENVLMEQSAMKAGRLTLRGGTSYRLLATGDTEAVSPGALRQMERLVAAGAVIVGKKPSRTTGLIDGRVDDAEVRATAGRLWGDCEAGGHAYKKGRVFCQQPATEVLRALHIATDFSYTGGTVFDYAHRVTEDADWYFIRSTSDKNATGEFTLRGTGDAKRAHAEVWRPDTGMQWAASGATVQADGAVKLPLAFEPYGSAVVMLRRDARQLPEEKRNDWSPVLTLDGSWAVRFEPGWDAPAKVDFPQLASWSESEDPGVRYYSGSATYSKLFVLSAEAAAGKRLAIDLGEVREIARVVLNGKDLGIVWKRPFQADVTGVAKAGRNSLEVTVVNLWPNRLIGDQALPPEKRRTATNITKYKANSALLPSGLLGPVSIVTEK